MKVKLKSSDAINLHQKSQTLFLNMPESNASLEWNSKVLGIPEIKAEQKGFSSYNEAKAMLSTTHIRLPHQFRMSEGTSSLHHVSRSEILDKEIKNTGFKTLPNFETLKKNRLHQQANSGTKTPNPTNSIERSPKQANETLVPSRHVSFQNLSMVGASTTIKRKMNWHVDQEALLSKKRLENVTKLIKSISFLEDSSSKELTATLLHLTEYFESMLQRLFYENKAKFTSSTYFKTLFAEEFHKEIPKRQIQEEATKTAPVPTPIKTGTSQIHTLMTPNIKKMGSLISNMLISPGITPSTSDRMLPRFTNSAVASAEKPRKGAALNMDPSNEFFRRHSLLYKSYNHRYVREWTENVTPLNPLEQFTVLVVDDVPDQVNNAIDILTSWNEIACEGAYDGLEAVQMVRNKMNEGKMYHLILTDLTMPHDGFETTKDIRKEEANRNTKPKNCIIGVTAEGLSSISDVKAKQSGMDDTITKPLRRDILATMIMKRAEELGIELSLTDNYS